MSMKQPDLKECPCCGAETTTDRCGNVEPRCVQAQGSNGDLAYSCLSWHCRVCGCEWRHGQFEEEKAKAVAEPPAAPPPDSIDADQNHRTHNGQRFEAVQTWGHCSGCWFWATGKACGLPVIDRVCSPHIRADGRTIIWKEVK